ncbi:MAG: DNRLRE domain-containing protein, partial [Anaerolineae bacterium]|nr:DNRLRE domain-containing protein [Anaerolineae bacterium]
SWDLTSIPAGSIIQSVDITVNVTNTSTNNYEFYEMKRPWVEGAATWNEYAFGLGWEVAGADGSGDRGTTVLGAITAATTGLQTFSLNASGVAMVQSWVDNPATNHGFAILDYINASNGLDFSSRENGTVSNCPKLTVTYSGGSQPKLAVPPRSESDATALSTETLPQTITLNPSYPNPFNLETRIEYALPKPGRVSLVIYNVRGQQVRKLVDEIQSGGFKRVLWNGRDDFGQGVGSGVYLIRLVVGQQRFVGKLLLQK